MNSSETSRWWESAGGGAATEGANGNGLALYSSSNIGAANRVRLLQALYDHGPTSRAELARMAGVNRTTVSGIAQPLIAEGLLVEGAASRSGGQGGKPARPLYFDPSAPALGAVLLLPGVVQTCLVTLTGGISAVHRARFEPTGDQKAVAQTIASTLARTLSEAEQRPFGVGVAAGGMIDSDRGTIVAVNLAPVLDNLPLVDILQSSSGLRVVIDHHPRALLVGDRWFGPGRGLQNFAVIYTGEVLGGALYLNGEVYRGLAGSGGELGHTVVAVNGDLCNCGKRGCWETIATLQWLRREAASKGLTDPEAMTTQRLKQLADQGSAAASDLLAHYVRNIAVGIANLQQVMSPNFYIVHGDVALGDEAVAGMIKNAVESLTVKRPNQDITILVNGNGDGMTALRGAAGLVLSSMFKQVV